MVPPALCHPAVPGVAWKDQDDLIISSNGLKRPLYSDGIADLQEQLDLI